MQGPSDDQDESQTVDLDIVDRQGGNAPPDPHSANDSRAAHTCFYSNMNGLDIEWIVYFYELPTGG